MIKVTIGTNTDRDTVIVEPTKTLKSLFEDQGIDYSRGTIHLDGAALKPGDLGKTLADMNVTEKCFLISVIKVDNAA